MANRIRGITVEIGGDVTGLDKALNTVNKTIKDTQSQLKDVERLLKLDPSNTELLTQKQRLLKDAVGATKEKLDALKTAQEQAKQQLENGTLGQDKYDALQREIIDTENELDKLTKKAGEANTSLVKLGETGKGIEEVGNKITGVGEGFTKYVTAPITAIGAASMAAFSEVDSAIDGMITKTGAAGEELEKMETAVQNLATTIPTDFQTAANAVGEVSTRFNDVGEDLEDLSGKFVKFATVNNVDVVTAVDNVQSSMAAFNVPTEQAGDVLDTLNAIAQQTGTDVTQLTSMMTANAGVAKEMGMDYEDTASFLANLNKNGVDASSVMTGLKKAWQTASKEGKSMDDMLSDMNTTILSAKTDQEAYQKAIELFGAKAGPAIAQAMRDGRLSLDEMNASMSDYAGNLENTFDATLDPIDQTTLMMNELKLVGADLAATAQEMLVPLLETLREKLQQLREWWSGLSDEQQQSIIKFAGIAAAIGPALMAIGNLTSGVGKGLQAFSKMGTGISTLITQTQAGTGPLVALKGAIAGISAPVLAVVAVIGVLVAAFVNLWKNNEEFREKITGIWEGIKEKFETFANGIKERLSGLGISFSSITETIKKVWDGFCELLAPVFEGAFQQISNIIDFVLNTILNVLDVFIAVFKGDWSGAWDAVKNIFSNSWDFIKNTLDNVLNTMKGVADKFLSWFGTSWDKLWTSVKDFFTKIWNGIKDFFVNTWNSIKETATNSVNKVKDTIKTGFENAKSTVTSIFDSIKEKITSAMDTAREKVHNAIDQIKGFFNFHWELPKLKMPHFSITGSFSLNPPSVPHLSVDWYKKAMQNGMILNSPTIFGMKNGRFLGAGEAGSETVVGTNALLTMIKEAVANAGRSYGDVNVIVNGAGKDAAEIAREIGLAVSRERRMAGSW